jgi:hypothetical protein
MQVAQQAGLTRKIMADLGEIMKKTDHFSFGFRLPSGTRIDIDEKQMEVTEVSAVLSIHPRYRDVKWKTFDVNGQAVAAGTFPADFLFPGAAGDSVVTASQGSYDNIKVSLLGPSDTDIQLEVFPHALWPNTTDHCQGD